MEPLSRPEPNTWHKSVPTGEYVISTSQRLIDLEFVNRAFATDDMYWAKPLPLAQLQLLLLQSDTLGLYKRSPAEDFAEGKNVDRKVLPQSAGPSREEVSRKEVSREFHSPSSSSLTQIGIARFISDRVTTAYLTDVYIVPEERGSGLGKWLIACCKEIIDSLPAMRRVVLVATPGVTQTFYTRELGFWDVNEEREHLVIMTKNGYRAPASHEGASADR